MQRRRPILLVAGLTVAGVVLILAGLSVTLPRPRVHRCDVRAMDSLESIRMAEARYLAEGKGARRAATFEELTADSHLGGSYHADRGGIATRGGYHFRIDRSSETPESWWAYAWPVAFGDDGEATFVIDSDGTVLFTHDPDYAGDHGPPAGAAFADGRLAVDGTGADGNRWCRDFVGRCLGGDPCRPGGTRDASTR